MKHTQEENKRLLIIADDFTGAMDAGVQFARRGFDTLAICDYYKGTPLEFNGSEVVVINSDSRHSSEKDAYDVVREIADSALENGFDYIYKKTDSVLRGNIGAELSALADAVGQSVFFVPAYPQLGRTTKNGVQFAYGIPVAESALGNDPFNPISSSNVADIYMEQSNKRVVTHLVGDYSVDRDCGVNIYDSETDADMLELADAFMENGGMAAAGCAGFASVFSRALGCPNGTMHSSKLSSKMLISCGSMNPVTIAQLNYAQEHDIPRIRIPAQVKLSDSDCYRLEAIAQHASQMIASRGSVIIDSNDPHGSDITGEYADRLGISKTERMKRITSSLAEITKKVMDCDPETVVFCTGGDTLRAIMHALDAVRMRPVKELYAGVVLAELEYGGKVRCVITKSGGFGETELLVNLINDLKGKDTEK